MAQPPLSAAIRQLERDLGGRSLRPHDPRGEAHRRRTRVPRRRAADAGGCRTGGRGRQARGGRRARASADRLFVEHPLRDAPGARQGVPGRPPGRRAPGPGDVERPDAGRFRATAASTSPSPSAPRSPPSWSSPRYARSASSRSCPTAIRSRARRRSRSPRSPTRSSSCSRARSRRGCTTRSWRSTAAPASSRECATSRSTPDGTSGSWPRSRPSPSPRKRSPADFPTGSSRSRSASRPTRSRPAWSGAATTARRPSRPSWRSRARPSASRRACARPTLTGSV